MCGQISPPPAPRVAFSITAQTRTNEPRHSTLCHNLSLRRNVARMRSCKIGNLSCTLEHVVLLISLKLLVMWFLREKCIGHTFLDLYHGRNDMMYVEIRLNQRIVDRNKVVGCKFFLLYSLKLLPVRILDSIPV